MSKKHFKKNKRCICASGYHTFQLIGIILLILGATTLCAFLLPLKIWVFLLGSVLLLSGILMLIS